jgi:hypothetical protein
MVECPCRILLAVHVTVPPFPSWSVSHTSTSGNSQAYCALPLSPWVSGKRSSMADTFIVLPATGQSQGMRATSVGAASISHRMPPFPLPAHAPSAQTTIVMPSHTPHVLIFTTVVPPPYPTRVAVRSISWTQQHPYVIAVGVRWSHHRAMVVIADGEGIRKGTVARKVFAGVIRHGRHTLVRHACRSSHGASPAETTCPHCRADDTAGDNRSRWIDATAAPPLIPRNPSILLPKTTARHQPEIVIAWDYETRQVGR